MAKKVKWLSRGNFAVTSYLRMFRVQKSATAPRFMLLWQSERFFWNNFTEFMFCYIRWLPSSCSLTLIKNCEFMWVWTLLERVGIEYTTQQNIYNIYKKLGMFRHLSERFLHIIYSKCDANELWLSNCTTGHKYDLNKHFNFLVKSVTYKVKGNDLGTDH